MILSPDTTAQLRALLGRRHNLFYWSHGKPEKIGLSRIMDNNISNRTTKTPEWFLLWCNQIINRWQWDNSHAEVSGHIWHDGKLYVSLKVMLPNHGSEFIRISCEQNMVTYHASDSEGNTIQITPLQAIAFARDPWSVMGENRRTIWARPFAELGVKPSIKENFDSLVISVTADR